MKKTLLSLGVLTVTLGTPAIIISCSSNDGQIKEGALSIVKSNEGKEEIDYHVHQDNDSTSQDHDHEDGAHLVITFAQSSGELKIQLSRSYAEVIATKIISVLNSKVVDNTKALKIGIDAVIEDLANKNKSAKFSITFPSQDLETIITKDAVIKKLLEVTGSLEAPDHTGHNHG